MSRTILISTGARLHFGFIAHAGQGPPRVGDINYGGVGLMIDSPGFVLAATGHEFDRGGRGTLLGEVAESRMFEVGCHLKKAGAVESDPFAGPPLEAWKDVQGRTLKLIEMYQTDGSRGDRRPPSCSMELRSAIPSHRGLGAGTQLGLAVAKALSALSGEADVDAIALARRVGRGARSAIGIHGFERGGFLVDAGKEQADEIGKLAARVEVPADWRFLLIDPPGQAAGLSGSAESAALSRLPRTSDAMTERLHRLAFSEMLPALSAADGDRFGEAVFEFGRTVGEYFRPIQGGTYSTSAAGELVDWIRGQGYRGVAQTSWGPTLAVCCPSLESADALRERIQSEPRWHGCAMRIVKPLNTGATVRPISADAD